MIHFMTDETRTERHGNQICTMHNVDGYTTRKTYLGAVHEIGKAIAKIDAGEGELLISAKTETEAKQLQVANVFEGPVTYCFELEEVSCASEWDEEADEMKYEEGHFYFHIRFFVWEDAEEETEEEEQEQEQEAGKMTVAFIANMLKDDFLLKLTDAETGKTYAEKTAGELVSENIQDPVKDWDLFRSTIYI